MSTLYSIHKLLELSSLGEDIGLNPEGQMMNVGLCRQERCSFCEEGAQVDTKVKKLRPIDLLTVTQLLSHRAGTPTSFYKSIWAFTALLQPATTSHH